MYDLPCYIYSFVFLPYITIYSHYYNLLLVKILRKQTTIEVNNTFTETKTRGHSSSSETQVVVAWLQDFSDHLHFPIFDLLTNLEGMEFPQTSNTGSRAPEKEICIIFIHPLKTGLYRVKVKTVFG